MIGFLYAIVSMFGFASNQIFNKRLTLRLDAYNAFLAREMYLVVLLFIATMFLGEFRAIDLRTLVIILIGGVIGMIAFLSLLKSFSYLPLSITLTVANAFPFFTLLLTMIFYLEYPSLGQFLVMLLVLLGIFITVYRKSNMKFEGYKYLILPVVTAIGWGIYFFCIYSLSELNLNPFNLSLYLEFSTLIVLVGYILIKNNLDRNTFFYTNFGDSFAAGIGSCIALIASVYAMKTVVPAVVSSILSAQLIVISLISISLFKEKLSIRQFIGIFIVFVGLVLYNFV